MPADGRLLSTLGRWLNTPKHENSCKEEKKEGKRCILHILRISKTLQVTSLSVLTRGKAHRTDFPQNIYTQQSSCKT